MATFPGAVVTVEDEARGGDRHRQAEVALVLPLMRALRAERLVIALAVMAQPDPEIAGRHSGM
jgi:hypothetical protein